MKSTLKFLILIMFFSVTVMAETKPFQCTGHWASASCNHTLYFNRCKNSVKIRWDALQDPGTKQWAKTRQNWCSVTWDGENAVEERKFDPKKCTELMKLLHEAIVAFPEVKWQDAKCTHIGSEDAILYTSQTFPKPKGAPISKDPEPVAIGLEDATECVLFNKKRRELHCPVLAPHVHTWVKKFLGFFGAKLVIKNVAK